MQNAHTIDQHKLFAADGMLLLGELCEISDECDFDWGSESDDA